MTEYRAADLPDGSIIATDLTVAIKRPGPAGMCWWWTGGGPSTDAVADDELGRGATVLRVGTGREG